jgi:hypothetical protein
MCNLTENFMEDAIFHNQLRQEYEFRMWEQFIKEKEAEEQAYDKMAEQYFKDLEESEEELETV